MRVLYITGGGDPISSFKWWRAGKPEPTQVSETFSSQVYAFAELVGARLIVIGSNPDGQTHRDGAFLLMHRPRSTRRWRGPLYHLAQLVQLARFLACASRHRCRHIIMDSGNVPLWAVAPLTFLGLRFVPVMHNTLWTGDPPSPRGIGGVLQRLQGVALGRCPAVLCVSGEVRRQVELLSGRARCVPVLPMFHQEMFAEVEPNLPRKGEAFRTFFAGRVERVKGVFDVLDAAEMLERERPGGFRWELAGDGSALGELRAECTRRGLDPIVSILGPLDRRGMREAYERSHAVIVPTRTEFPEGFCMVAAEGVLARRPVVTSRVVPAHEHLKGACLLAEPDNAASYAAQIRRLADDDALYRSLIDAGERLRAPFFDRRNSVTWGLGRTFGAKLVIQPESVAETVLAGDERSAVAD